MTDQNLPPQNSEQPNYGGAPSPVSPEQRKARLAQTLASQVAGGKRVESHSEYQAVLVAGKPVNHTLHLILTLVTCGAWGLVWLLLAVVGGEKRSVLMVDDYGNVLNNQ
jgi:hypothetical protein